MRCALTLGRSLLSPLPQDARLGFEEKLLAYGEVCRNFRPVFRYFCMERFLDPAVWMEKRLAYTRSVATSSIGTPLAITSLIGWRTTTSLTSLPRGLFCFFFFLFCLLISI